MQINKQTITFAIIAACGINFSLFAADDAKDRLVREYVQSIMMGYDNHNLKHLILDQKYSDDAKRDFKTFRIINLHIGKRNRTIDSISATGKIIENVAHELGLKKVRIFTRNPDDEHHLTPMQIQVTPH